VDTTTLQDEAIAKIRKQFGSEADLDQSPRTKNVFLAHPTYDGTFVVSRSGWTTLVWGPDKEVTVFGHIAQDDDIDGPTPRKQRKTRAKMSAKRDPEYLNTVSPTRQRGIRR